MNVQVMARFTNNLDPTEPGMPLVDCERALEENGMRHKIDRAAGNHFATSVDAVRKRRGPHMAPVIRWYVADAVARSTSLLGCGANSASAA